jgi:hypothetical protein
MINLAKRQMVAEEEEERIAEEETESMMSLMNQIKNMREINKTLSDEERRKNAQELIL